MSLPEYKQECYILDDEELAKADVAPKPEPDYEKRSWKLNESERMKNPFQKDAEPETIEIPIELSFRRVSIHNIRPGRLRTRVLISI